METKIHVRRPGVLEAVSLPAMPINGFYKPYAAQLLAKLEMLLNKTDDCSAAFAGHTIGNAVANNLSNQLGFTIAGKDLIGPWNERALMDLAETAKEYLALFK